MFREEILKRMKPFGRMDRKENRIELFPKIGKKKRSLLILEVLLLDLVKIILSFH